MSLDCSSWTRYILTVDRCNWYSCGKGGVNRYKTWADGCSASVFSSGMDHFFEPVCNIHDRCYITPGTTQQDCDRQFLQNMRNKCEMPGSRSLFSYPVCFAMANVAFEVVASIDQFPSKIRMKRSCHNQRPVQLTGPKNQTEEP